MFDAPCCIYDTLYETIRDDFCAVGNYEPSVDGKFFKSVDRGIPAELTRAQVNSQSFPRAYLDWGMISAIKPYRSPQGFTYDLIVPFNVVTYLGPESAVFAPGSGDYGIGDMVTLVTKKFWAEHYPSKFSKAIPYNTSCPEPEIPDLTGTDADKRLALRQYSEALKQYDLKKSELSTWAIRDFSLSVGTGVESQPGEVQFISDSPFRGNPEVRGTTCFFKFQIFEQEAY